jgi:uncharacterized membrane protein YfcA
MRSALAALLVVALPGSVPAGRVDVRRGRPGEAGAVAVRGSRAASAAQLHDDTPAAANTTFSSFFKFFGGGGPQNPPRFTPEQVGPLSSTGVLHAESDAIVQAKQLRRWWGFPNYHEDLDTGPRSWEEFARLHGHLGKTCTSATARQQCGTAFVCRTSVCVECAISRDCGEHYVCVAPASGPGRRLCIHRDITKQWSWREGVCTVLIVLTAMLSAAAGMGGGGVYVPLLLLLCGFSTQEAVPLSQAMIVGGAVVNIIMFCGERHPKYPSRPKIDYDVVMMLNPGLAAGVTVGVMINIISPQWVIILVLIVTLVLALQKSYSKGIAQWKQESEALAAAQAALQQSGGGPGSAGSGAGGKAAGPIQIKLADFRTFSVLANENFRPLALITGCWAVFLIANILKAKQCSLMYWAQLVGLLAVCGAFTLAGARIVTEQACAKDVPEGMLAWTPSTLWMYPLLSTTAGFLGGFLGIGGGIIMGPLLLELGMTNEASQATTAMFVFLSSSLATIQFVVLGKALPDYSLWFTVWVIVATFFGQTGVDYALKKWQRSSVIVLSIAGIIAGSLLMMSSIGALDLVSDIMRGAYMGFSPSRLCT